MLQPLGYGRFIYHQQCLANRDFRWVSECTGRYVCQVTSLFFSKVLNVNAEFLCGEQIVVICLVTPELFRGLGLFSHVFESML